MMKVLSTVSLLFLCQCFTCVVSIERREVNASSLFDVDEVNQLCAKNDPKKLYWFVKQFSCLGVWINYYQNESHRSLYESCWLKYAGMQYPGDDDAKWLHFFCKTDSPSILMNTVDHCFLNNITEAVKTFDSQQNKRYFTCSSLDFSRSMMIEELTKRADFYERNEAEEKKKYKLCRTGCKADDLIRGQVLSNLTCRSMNNSNESDLVKHCWSLIEDGEYPTSDDDWIKFYCSQRYPYVSINLLEECVQKHGGQSSNCSLPIAGSFHPSWNYIKQTEEKIDSSVEEHICKKSDRRAIDASLKGFSLFPVTKAILESKKNPVGLDHCYNSYLNKAAPKTESEFLQIFCSIPMSTWREKTIRILSCLIRIHIPVLELSRDRPTPRSEWHEQLKRIIEAGHVRWEQELHFEDYSTKDDRERYWNPLFNPLNMKKVCVDNDERQLSMLVKRFSCLRFWIDYYKVDSHRSLHQSCWFNYTGLTYPGDDNKKWRDFFCAMDSSSVLINTVHHCFLRNVTEEGAKMHDQLVRRYSECSLIDMKVKTRKHRALNFKAYTLRTLSDRELEVSKHKELCIDKPEVEDIRYELSYLSCIEKVYPDENDLIKKCWLLVLGANYPSNDTDWLKFYCSNKHPYVSLHLVMRCISKHLFTFPMRSWPEDCEGPEPSTLNPLGNYVNETEKKIIISARDYVCNKVDRKIIDAVLKSQASFPISKTISEFKKDPAGLDYCFKSYLDNEPPKNKSEFMKLFCSIPQSNWERANVDTLSCIVRIYLPNDLPYWSSRFPGDFPSFSGAITQIFMMSFYVEPRWPRSRRDEAEENEDVYDPMF